MTRAQRAEIQELFRLLDADGSGALDVDEVLAGFRVLNIPTRRSEVEGVLHEMGVVECDYTTFEDMVSCALPPSPSPLSRILRSLVDDAAAAQLVRGSVEGSPDSIGGPLCLVARSLSSPVAVLQHFNVGTGACGMRAPPLTAGFGAG